MADTRRSSRLRSKCEKPVQVDPREEAEDEALMGDLTCAQQPHKDKEIIHLLMRNYDDIPDISPELTAWRQDLSEIYSQGTLWRRLGLSGVAIPTAQLYLLLMECVSTHRWRTALQVLMAVCKEPVLRADTISKVALEIFAHYSDKDVLLELFINQLHKAGCQDVKQLTLDYALMLIKDGHHEEANKRFQSSFRRPGAFKRVESEEVTLLFQAYHGLLSYTEWLQATQAKEQLDQQQKSRPLDILAETSHLEEKQKILAEKALSRFQGIEQIYGLWDIFVNKIVQLHEFLEDLEAALQVLCAYAGKNPDNPNTQRMLFRFYERHDHHGDKKIEALQKFCDAVPSDILALTLNEALLGRGTSPGECIYLVFDLLDFPCWADHLQAWTQLQNQLITIATRGSDQDKAAVRSCWQERSNWWPASHFRASQMSGRALEQGHQVKAVVATMLMGAGSAYAAAVAEGCEEEELGEQLREATLYHDALMQSNP